jgi:hypothetical protein
MICGTSAVAYELVRDLVARADSAADVRLRMTPRRNVFSRSGSRTHPEGARRLRERMSLRCNEYWL